MLLLFVLLPFTFVSEIIYPVSAAAILQVAGQVLPSHGAHATLVRARNRQPWALVLMALGPETEAVVNNRTLVSQSQSTQVNKGLT